MVVAYWQSRPPPTPEICGSNPVIGKLLSNICLLSTVLKRRTKIKKKEARNGPFKKYKTRYVNYNQIRDDRINVIKHSSL